MLLFPTMLARLKATLQSNVIRPFLVFFGMSTAKLPFIKDSTSFSVVMYYDWFMSNPLDLETYRVVQVNCYKNMDATSQHEKIVAKITTRAEGVYGYLCFERTRGSSPQTLDHFKESTDPHIQNIRLALIEDRLLNSGSLVDETLERKDGFTSKSEPTSKQSPKSSTNSVSSFSSSLDSFQLKSNAVDTVAQIDGFPRITPTLSKKKPTGIQLVDTLTPRDDLLLCDLVALAYTIHIQNPIYIVFKEQCYWFANMIMRILQREYGHVDSATDTDLTTTDEHIDEVCEGASGKWYSIRVHKAKESILEIITSQFKINLNAFKARVCNANFCICN